MARAGRSVWSGTEKMNPTENTFREAAFVKARLFREPMYRADDPPLRAVLRSSHEEVRGFFRQIGQEAVFDEAEGYAFIRQIEPVGEDKVPCLVQKPQLNYE